MVCRSSAFAAFKSSFFEVISLQHSHVIQPIYAPKRAACDTEFSPAFYKPYEAAVETAFLTLCAARTQFELDTPYAVRSMTFRLKSPASLQDKLVRRGLAQDASGAAMLNAEVTRQAAAIGYANDFWLMMVLTLCAMPLVLLMHSGRHEGNGASASEAAAAAH